MRGFRRDAPGLLLLTREGHPFADEYAFRVGLRRIARERAWLTCIPDGASATSGDHPHWIRVFTGLSWMATEVAGRERMFDHYRE